MEEIRESCVAAILARGLFRARRTRERSGLIGVTLTNGTMASPIADDRVVELRRSETIMSEMSNEA